MYHHVLFLSVILALSHAVVLRNYGSCQRCYWEYRADCLTDLDTEDAVKALGGEAAPLFDVVRVSQSGIGHAHIRTAGVWKDGLDICTFNSTGFIRVKLKFQECGSTFDGPTAEFTPNPAICNPSNRPKPASVISTDFPKNMFSVDRQQRARNDFSDRGNWTIVDDVYIYDVAELGLAPKTPGVSNYLGQSIPMAAPDWFTSVNRGIDFLYAEVSSYGAAIVNFSATGSLSALTGNDSLPLILSTLRGTYDGWNQCIRPDLDRNGLPRNPNYQECPAEEDRVIGNAIFTQSDPPVVSPKTPYAAGSGFGFNTLGFAPDAYPPVEYSGSPDSHFYVPRGFKMPSALGNEENGARLWCNAGTKLISGVGYPNNPTSQDNLDYYSGKQNTKNPVSPINTQGYNTICCGKNYGNTTGLPNEGDPIRCQWRKEAGICICSEGLTGLDCLDEFEVSEFDPNKKDETCRDDVDICMGRGKCVPKAGGGIACVCRPGWFGGGSFSDPPGISASVMRDMYASLILSPCYGYNNVRYDINSGAQQWLENYPKYHQCMLWNGVFSSWFDFETNLPRWTNSSDNPISPVYPFDCGNHTAVALDGGVTVHTGPLYGGFWCNQCEGCYLPGTERCGDKFPNAHEATSRDDPLAAVVCICREEYGGEFCEQKSCPITNYSDPLNIEFYGRLVPPESQDRSPCQEKSGHGKCAIPRRTGDYAFRALPESDGYPAWGEPGFAGRCVCEPGFVGPSCERGYCTNLTNTTSSVCSQHGTCVLKNCTTIAESPPFVFGGFHGSENPWAEAFCPFETEAECLNPLRRPLFPEYLTHLGITEFETGTNSCRFKNNVGIPDALNCGTFQDGVIVGAPIDGWLGTLRARDYTLATHCTFAECECVEEIVVNGVKETVDTGFEGPTCDIRKCNFVNGKECNGLLRHDTGESVCNRDHVNPVCECWRALPSPEFNKFDITDGNHFYNGPAQACDLNYSTVCEDPVAKDTCSGTRFSRGCYITGCANNWTKCEQLFNRSAAVPECVCKEDKGVFGDTCGLSVCNNTAVSKACSAGGEGLITTGTCDPDNQTCICWPASKVAKENPGAPDNVAYYGDYCQFGDNACLGLGGLICSGHGKCIGEPSGPFSCVCEPDYLGATCNSTLSCGATCNPEGGHCISGVCNCFRNFIGANCETNACNSTGGNSTGHNLCECPEGSRQYPSAKDPFYKAPPGNGDLTPENMNPTGLSTFRGCRKLCEVSEFVKSDIECGGYTDLTGTKSETRCRDYVAANNDTRTPVCSCSPGSTCTNAADLCAPNPNVDQFVPGISPPIKPPVPWLTTPDGLSCRPECTYCFIEGPGLCNPKRCDGTEGWEEEGKCQYPDSGCFQRPCDGHSDHVWDSALNKCVCRPDGLFDDTGNCTRSNTLCEQTGGTLAEWPIQSGYSKPCICNYPLTVFHSRTKEDSFKCTSACGEFGKPDDGNTQCVCIPGGVFTGQFCTNTGCLTEVGATPDVVRDSSGDAVSCDSCTCSLVQLGGTFCNESQCVAGVGKSPPENGCDCYTGWEGDLCDQNTGCGPFGKPNSTAFNSVCECDPGWNGTLCDNNRCAGTLPDSEAPTEPVPCEHETTALVPCDYPNLDYNCKCGDTHAIFDNATGGCRNTSHLDCGPFGIWHKYPHNDSHACICQKGWTGTRCERHVCGSEFGPTNSHHLVTVVLPDGYEVYECECNTPEYKNESGVCVKNCSFGEVVFPDTWQRLVNNASNPEQCVCPNSSYVPFAYPATPSNPDFPNASLGFQCVLDCNLTGTEQILNTTCVCAVGCSGTFCDTCVFPLPTPSPSSDPAPWYVWASVAGFALLVLAFVLIYFSGSFCTACYKSRADQMHKKAVFNRTTGESNQNIPAAERAQAVRPPSSQAPAPAPAQSSKARWRVYANLGNEYSY